MTIQSHVKSCDQYCIREILWSVQHLDALALLSLFQKQTTAFRPKHRQILTIHIYREIKVKNHFLIKCEHVCLAPSISDPEMAQTCHVSRSFNSTLSSPLPCEPSRSLQSLSRENRKENLKRKKAHSNFFSFFFSSIFFFFHRSFQRSQSLWHFVRFPKKISVRSIFFPSLKISPLPLSLFIRLFSSSLVLYRSTTSLFSLTVRYWNFTKK